MKRCCVSGTWRTLFSRSLHRLPKAFSRCGSRLHSSPCMFHERSRADGHIDASALHAPQRLTNSDEVDVFYDDGWWLMTFMGTRRSASGTEYHVRSDLYQVERWVPADHVRPHWKRWGAKWRQLDQMRKQPAQAKAPPKKAESPSPKAAAPNATGPAAAAAAPAKAAAAAPAKAAPLGKIASPSSEAGGARNGARPTKAASGSAPPPTPWPMTGTTQWPMTGTAGELCGQMLPWVGAWLACMCSPRRPLRPDAPVGRCLACMHVLTTAPSAARCSGGSVPGLHACAHHGAQLLRWVGAWLACMCSPRRLRLPTTGELCGQMLRQMRAREEAAWFEHPVSLVDVPDYLAFISHPMDYSTMGKKLADGEYSAGLLSFAADMRLIFRNALAYNWDSENEYHRAAKQVCSPRRAHWLPKPEQACKCSPRRAAPAPSLRARRSHAACPPVLPRLRSDRTTPMTTLRPDDAHDDAPTGRRP